VARRTVNAVNAVNAMSAVRRWPVSVPEAWRARAGDVGCILLALLIGGLATDATDVATTAYADANDLIGAAAAGALWWRRRAPLAVATLTFVASAAAPMAAGASVLGVFSLAAHHRRRVPLALAVLYVSCGVVAVALFPDEDLGVLANVTTGALVTLTAVGWGLARRSRRELMASLAERAERAEADQHARVAETRRAERTRIAAEMHDVLAHRLSMLSLQAGAIELRPDSAPEDLARAAGAVRSGAHLALEELRAVIGVLRYDDLADTAPEARTDGADLADLATLVAECRDAGMRIDVVDDPLDATALPPTLARHAYRIVQEGLTNARKHAPGAPVGLSVTSRAGDGACIEVTNPTRNSAGVPYAGTIPGAGVGLIGVQERVELLGGTLEHDTDDAGNHRLRAWLPWPA
jgi:signal transduction histidine kinase